MDKLLTIHEVADSLRIHQKTLYRWIKEGKVKVVHIGPRTIRISPEELNRITYEH